jgi:hypothetical protein
LSGRRRIISEPASRGSFSTRARRSVGRQAKGPCEFSRSLFSFQFGTSDEEAGTAGQSGLDDVADRGCRELVVVGGAFEHGLLDMWHEKFVLV